MIIDALDECPLDSRERLFDLLLDRIDHDGDKDRAYNFMFTSRREPDIETRLTELHAPVRTIPIPVDCVNADVRLHVARFIEKSRAMKNLPGHLKTDIQDTLSEKAQGM